MRVLLALALGLPLLAGTLLVGCGHETATAPVPPSEPLRAGSLPFPDDSTVDVFVVPGYGLHLEQAAVDGERIVRDVRVAFGPDPDAPGRMLERETVLRPDGTWYRSTFGYHPGNSSAPVRLAYAVPGEEQALTIERAGNLATYTLVWTRDGERREATTTLDLSRWGEDPAVEEARTRFADAFADFAADSRLLASSEPEFLAAFSGHDDLEAVLRQVATGKDSGGGIDAYLREFCAMGKNIQKMVCALGLLFPQFTPICAASVPANALCDLLLAMRAAQLDMNDPSQPDTVCTTCWTPPDSSGN